MTAMGARRACITGGAGFIGSNLADRVLAAGGSVTILDDFRTGRREFVADALRRGARLVEGDVLDPAALDAALAGCEIVFHLQANADVRHGLEHPRRDLEQNTLATAAVLEGMRAHEIARIVFASSGSVYGEPSVFPTPEDCPFPVQTSLYAASKLAGEALIEAYAAGYGFSGVICRFVSILGERYTHGHLFDFYRALKRDPTRLRVLGDGRQEKSYLDVEDCIDGLLTAAERHRQEPGAHIYNLGTDETIVVEDSLRILLEHLALAPRIEYAGGQRGWVGDSPLIHLDTARLRALGWRPRRTIAQAVAGTLRWFDANEYAWREPVGGAPPRAPREAAEMRATGAA
jgi:UDP-glucose 4-epimerase